MKADLKMPKKRRGVRDQLALDIPLTGLAGPRRTSAHNYSERVFGVVSAQSLMHLQRLVTSIEIERGTYHENVKQKALLLGEEVHEVLKELRIHSGIATAEIESHSLGDELTDVLFVSSAIANRTGIDLGIALLSSHLESYAEPSDVLTAALDLSKWSLSVIRDCKVFHELPQGEDERDTLDISLAGVVRSVAWVAVFAEISLAEAIDRKLAKDQIRRWK